MDDLSLHIAPGEIFGFIGHNGAGKTTTLKACCGILQLTKGDIFVAGHSIQKEPLACKQELAYIPDNPDLYDFLTGLQYLNFVADIYGVSQADRTTRIRKYGELLGMTDDLAQPISDCSHGMKQKIAPHLRPAPQSQADPHGRALCGLDPLASHQLKQVMAQRLRLGRAIFFSTHVLEVAEKLCHKVAIIKGGRLVASGSMEEVRGQASLEQVFLELEGQA